MQAVRVDAASRSNRSLTGGQPDGAASLRKRRVVMAEPVLLFPRRLIDNAVDIAKKTRYGLPTDSALRERWWISDWRPPKPSPADETDFEFMNYAFSFPCCCKLLGLDEKQERKRLLAEIDDANVKAMAHHFGGVMYKRRAQVLACAGVPTAVGRQYVLGLVSADDYEDVADPDQAKRVAVAVKRETRAAARVAAKRAKRLKAG